MSTDLPAPNVEWVVRCGHGECYHKEDGCATAVSNDGETLARDVARRIGLRPCQRCFGAARASPAVSDIEILDAVGQAIDDGRAHPPGAVVPSVLTEYVDLTASTLGDRCRDHDHLEQRWCITDSGPQQGYVPTNSGERQL